MSFQGCGCGISILHAYKEYEVAVVPPTSTQKLYSQTEFRPMMKCHLQLDQDNH